MPGAPAWRAAEAWALAGRIAELIETGRARAGEVVVLLRALGDARLYERALRARGLPMRASVGGFWSQQEVVDLLAYLRAVANPLDEIALYCTLAGPLAGLSSDALVWIARASREDERGVWETIGIAAGEGPAAESLRGRLSPEDRARLERFAGWFAGEREAARAAGVAELIERALAGGYGEHVLTLEGRERRMANVRKLAGIARELEAREGRDLRGFLEHAEQERGAGGAEPEAPVAEGGGDAVRLMSVHAAKGLEFPVVCVADLGRTAPASEPELLVEGERVGLRLYRLGEPKGAPTLAYEELCEERRAARAAEEDRILYVAMTRARERLLLSGAVDLERPPRAGGGGAPIAWLARGLVGDVSELARGGGSELELRLNGSRELNVRCQVNRPS
jgi:ATP-dependent exoDNAse (exonuclease V) beta subunit